MNLFSPEFFVFFLMSFFLYYSVKGKNQKILLFIFSIVFIGLFSLTFLLYILLFILINYLILIQIERNRQNAQVRNILYKTGMFFNIGFLVFFKYFIFLLEMVSQFLHIFNIPIQYNSIPILAPLGISFYTFQGVSYLIQVNRGNEHPEKNFIVFSNYFILFPKFLSGPIELSRKFIPQLRTFYKFHYQDIIEGFRLILWGTFKKMIIADRLVMIIDGVYPQLYSLSGNPLIITFLIQPLHLYFDFSGYTDIALGIGRTFGLKLTDNFNRPFFSTGVTEFWKRWHISLSSWCNEFIFMRISFKKRKWGKWSTAYAVFITFLVIGAWHGPRWTFIVLGLLQGIAITYEYFTKRFRSRVFSKLPQKINLYLSYIITYLFVCFSLIFFYAPNLHDAFYFISHMFSHIDISKLNLTYLPRFDKILLFFLLLFMFVIEFRQENGKDVFLEIHNWPKWSRRFIYYIFIILIIYFGSPAREFVYMQF